MPVPRITKETLQERLEATDETSPVLVDVRLKYPYEHSTVMLPDAIRLEPPDFPISELPKDRDIVCLLYTSDAADE